MEDDQIITNNKESDEDQTDIAEDIVTMAYDSSTYDLIFKVAYLIGVKKEIFGNRPGGADIFEKLDDNGPCRIIRNLSTLRSTILRHHTVINGLIRRESRNILTMYDKIPEQPIKELLDEGISFERRGIDDAGSFITEINKIISDRINNVKDVFPTWINWDYIRALFIMPNASNKKLIASIAKTYKETNLSYPYQMYLNFSIEEGDGNILSSDKKFAELLYKRNGDKFTYHSKVSNISGNVKNAIYEFINTAEKIVVIVDCENSDPYKFCAALQSLEEEQKAKIEKIILIDGTMTVSAWKTLRTYTDIPIEHIETTRLKAEKSMVDMKLAVKTCQEHYVNHTDKFIIASSDSDYWTLISSLDTAKFLVMAERSKTGADIKAALKENDIFFCYLDDFYSGDAEEIKQRAIILEIEERLKDSLDFNMFELFEDVLHSTRINMTTSEKRQFYDKFIRTIGISIMADGSITCNIKTK